MAGNRYGRLTVIGLDGRGNQGQRMWKCLCDCGNSTRVNGQLLRIGSTQSCGCLKKEFIASVNYRHGMAKTQIYGQWHAMMQRCYDKNSHAYNRYGGRGIAVCERWHTFENFYFDMGDRPGGMSLERRDNDGHYSQENVYWATTKEQANNRSTSKFVEHAGRRMTVAEWAEHSGIEMRTLWARIKRGIPMPEALENRDRRYHAFG